MIGAPQDVRHFHFDIVSDHAQMICGYAVGTQQHKVFQLGIRKLDAAKHCILEGSHSSFWNSKTNSTRSAFTPPLLHFFSRQPAASPVVFRSPPFCLRDITALLQFLLSAKTVVAMSGGQQTLSRGLIQIHAPRLKKRTFIPSDSQPRKALQNSIHHFIGGALEVRIFNPQNQSPAKMARVKPVKQRRSRPSNMQIAGRRRSKTQAGFSRVRVGNASNFRHEG